MKISKKTDWSEMLNFTLKCRFKKTGLIANEEELLCELVKQNINPEVSNEALKTLMVKFEGQISKDIRHFIDSIDSNIPYRDYYDGTSCAVYECAISFSPDKGRFSSLLKKITQRKLYCVIHHFYNGISEYYYTNSWKIEGLIDSFVIENGREPDKSEILEILGFSNAQYCNIEAESKRMHTFSLDEILEDFSQNLSETGNANYKELPTEKSVEDILFDENAHLALMINKALNMLGTQDMDMFCRYAGYGKYDRKPQTMERIARKYKKESEDVADDIERIKSRLKNLLRLCI